MNWIDPSIELPLIQERVLIQCYAPSSWSGKFDHQVLFGRLDEDGYWRSAEKKHAIGPFNDPEWYSGRYAETTLLVTRWCRLSIREGSVEWIHCADGLPALDEYVICKQPASGLSTERISTCVRRSDGWRYHDGSSMGDWPPIEWAKIKR